MLELKVRKGAQKKRPVAEMGAYIRSYWPRGMSFASGCRLLGLPRSTVYVALVVDAGSAMRSREPSTRVSP